MFSYWIIMQYPFDCVVFHGFSSSSSKVVEFIWEQYFDFWFYEIIGIRKHFANSDKRKDINILWKSIPCFWRKYTYVYVLPQCLTWNGTDIQQKIFTMYFQQVASRPRPTWVVAFLPLQISASSYCGNADDRLYINTFSSILSSNALYMCVITMMVLFSIIHCLIWQTQLFPVLNNLIPIVQIIVLF